MEPTQPPPATTPPPTPSAQPSTPTTSQPTEQLPPPSQPPPPSNPTTATSSQLPSSTPNTTTSVSVAPPNLNPPTTTTTTISATKPIPTTTTTSTAAASAATRPPFHRPWQQQQPSPFQHFSLPPPPPPPPPHSSSSSSSTITSASGTIQNPRGGMAMGVPAHHHHPAGSSFSSLTTPSFGQQQFGRSLPDSSPTSTTSQVRQPIQGMHGVGMMGSLGSTSPMRLAGVPPQQMRPVPSSLRPQTVTSSQSAATQNFPGHSMLRVQSAGFPASQSHNTTSHSPRTLNQPWLSSGAQGKPPLPTPSLRPQISPQSLHQRPHILSQHQHIVTTTSSAQQSQPSTSSQSQDHLGLQMPPSRLPQSLTNHPLGRGQGMGIQRPSYSLMQSTAVQPGPPSKTSTLETEEPCARILSKRSIQEIVTQIDPSEKLDAEVEDILVDIAEEFVESITTFGCSLAKHRKSNTLEAKDILLHLERNWNMTFPGFGGDEIRPYKKPLTSDIHKERIAAIKKSALAAEMTNAKGTAQAGGNMKSHLAKGPAANILGSPNAKT